MTPPPRIGLARLLGRLDEFNRIGALPGGGNCRLALSDEDRTGRDLLVRWMRDLGLAVTVDAIGNIIGVRGGGEDRKSTRLNSSHLVISYAVFCLKKKSNPCWRARLRAGWDGSRLRT